MEGSGRITRENSQAAERAKNDLSQDPSAPWAGVPPPTSLIQIDPRASHVDTYRQGEGEAGEVGGRERERDCTHWGWSQHREKNQEMQRNGQRRTNGEQQAWLPQGLETRSQSLQHGRHGLNRAVQAWARGLPCAGATTWINVVTRALPSPPAWYGQRSEQSGDPTVPQECTQF